MTDQPGFCYDIFKNQAFWSFSDGSVAITPCSVYQGHVDKNIPADQSWFGDNHKKLIMMVQQGQQIPGCRVCYQQEKNGLRSRRQADQEHYQHFIQDLNVGTDSIGPISLDYSVGNLCNLKCVICGPQNSTAWIPDYQKLYPNKDASKYFYKKNNQVEINDPEYLRNIRSIHFHGGGEPLMGNAHLNLLQQIKNTKGLHDVRVYYNTNGTQIVSQEILDIWQECQLVELYFSIDDIGQRFEYQRRGASWHELTDNLQWFRENMPPNHMFKVNCVWGYLNFYYLDQLVDWHAANFSQNKYGDPCHLIFQACLGTYALKHLDTRVYGILETRFENYPMLSLLLKSIPIKQTGHEEFWHAIRQIDRVRESDFSKLCPGWSLLLS